MHIAVTGASGLIGSALVAHLTSAGHGVRTLVRRSPTLPTEVAWDPGRGEIDRDSLTDVEAFVHLAGAGVGDHRWTAEYKALVRSSRVQSTDLLASTVAEFDSNPTLISGSAVGFYGDAGPSQLDESAPNGSDFLASVCHDWEAATGPAEAAGLRVVHLRTGIVLSPAGGPLAKQLPLFKLGLGGRAGSGEQYMSWIAIDDMVAAIAHLLTSELSGPVNVTAPNPVTNAEFTKSLGRALRRPTTIIPMIGPRLLLGRELADALLLSGQRVVPRALDDDGFDFMHPRLDDALEHLLA